MTAPTADLPPLHNGELLLTQSGYNPTVEDVLEVRKFLVEEFVPVEIALLILSFASYGPRRSSTKQWNRWYEASKLSGWVREADLLTPKYSAAGYYLTLKIPTLLPAPLARPKSITFQMVAAEQGGRPAYDNNGGEATYDNSHTSSHRWLDKLPF